MMVPISLPHAEAFPLVHRGLQLKPVGDGLLRDGDHGIQPLRLAGGRGVDHDGELRAGASEGTRDLELLPVHPVDLAVIPVRRPGEELQMRDGNRFERREGDFLGQISQIRRAVAVITADAGVILIIGLAQTRHFVLQRVAVIVDLGMAHGGAALPERAAERVDPVAPAGADREHLRLRIASGKKGAGALDLRQREEIAFIQHNEIRLAQLGVLNVRKIPSAAQRCERRGFDEHRERRKVELSRKTGLRFLPQEQTGIQTAEAKFLRGDTMLWIPYPERPDETFGATSVASLPVPQTVATQLGATDMHREFEIFAAPGAPEQLVSIIRKVVAGIDPTQLQEMFMADYAERQVVHRVFGLTRRELLRRASWCGLAILLLVVIYGSIMMALLRRQARRANLAAAAAEEHARAKTRFLAMMSHELRTPLNAVIGFSEFLGRDGIDEKTRREYTDGILLSANALLELINDILDLSKLEAGSMNMRNGACNVNQLLRELPAIFGYRVRRHNVKLVVNAPETPVPTIGISQQGLRQILINLVGNSAKFTESGSITVSVGWAQASGTLHLVVSDTGCGISPEKMSKLFDPFVQDIKSRMINRAGEIKGSGLGLPIVKRMVENAGGTIRAESELGKGTSFFIDIPSLEVVREPSATGAPSDGADAGSGAGIVPERVLVVDDMSMNRKVLGIHLGNLGVKEVRYAENGRKALEVMDEWLPEVVLTDMWMPEMDGTQLAEAMHRERRFAEIPIVAVTADVDVGSSYDMSLFSKILAKPVTHAKLESLFHQL